MPGAMIRKEKLMKEIISDYINDKRQEIIDLLEKLVNIDSGSYTIEGVKAESKIIRSYLEQMGFNVRMLENDKYAPHILAKKTGRGEKNIMFLGHMDTVFPEGTAAKRPFTIKGDRAYGPGVCDMKAGLVSLIYALMALENAGYDSYGTLTILFNTDEERGSTTSEKYIIEECRKHDMVLVLEAGVPGNYVVIERQGGGIFNMDIWGRPAHAGANPLDGVHSITEACHKILALHALTDYDKGRSISVGVINGGSRSNIIPEHVFMEIDIRCKVNTDGLNLIEQMGEINDTCYVSGTRSKLTQVMYRPPIEKTPGNIDLYDKLQKVAHMLGTEVREQYFGGGSDGNYTSAEGIPTIDSVGPIGEFEHTDDEYVIVESIFSRTIMLGLFLIELTRKE